MIWQRQIKLSPVKIHSEFLVIEVVSMSRDDIALENFNITNFIFNSYFRQMLEKKVNRNPGLYDDIIRVELVKQN